MADKSTRRIRERQRKNRCHADGITTAGKA